VVRTGAVGGQVQRGRRAVPALVVAVVALLAGTLFAAPARAAVPRDGFWESDHQWTAPWTPGLHGFLGNFRVAGGGTRIEGFFMGFREMPAGRFVPCLQLVGVPYSAFPAALPVAPDGSFSYSEPGRISFQGAFVSPTRMEGTFRIDPSRCPQGGGTIGWWADLTRPDEGGGGEVDAPPAPRNEAGCEHQVSFGQIVVVAECLRREEGRYVLDGTARVNGLDLSVGGNGRIVLDPGALEIRATGNAEVELGGLTLYRGSFEWSASRAVTFRAAPSFKVKGLPVSGQAEVTWTPARASVSVNATLGNDLVDVAGGQITGALTLSATNEGGLSVDNLRIALEGSDVRMLRRLVLTGASVEYRGEEDAWIASATVQLPPPGPTATEVTGAVTIREGRFDGAQVQAQRINKPLGGVVFLQELGGSVSRSPLRISGNAGFSAGPELNVFGRDLSALGGDVELSWEDGDTFDTWTLSGTISMASFNVSEGEVVLKPGVSLDFSGNIQLEFARVGFNGAAEGWIEGRRRFQAHASGDVSLPLLGGGGEALVSSRGIAICGEADLFFGAASLSGGASYRWGDNVPRLFEGSCDFSAVEVARGSSLRAAQAGGRTLLLRNARPRGILLAVGGTGGAPRVALTGPGGPIVAGTPQGAARTPDAYYLEHPEAARTYIVLRRAPRGRYSVTPLPGSVPIDSLGTAQVLPRPRVRARVSGRGARRVLTYRVRRIPGQRIMFVERGGGISHTIGATSRARGRLRFRPALGRSGRRRIVAVVLQRGLARDELRVARFGYRRPKLGRARGVRARRRGGAVRVRWRHPGAASGFDVVLATRDGRRLLRVVGPRRRSVTFRGIGRRARGRASVIAWRTGGSHARPTRDGF
jgi:hypothetical protein